MNGRIRIAARANALSLAIAAMTALVAGCEAPSAELTGVSFKNIDLRSLTMVFEVKLTNPNPNPLPLVDLDYEITSRDSTFFAGQVPLSGQVPGNGDKTISLPVKIGYPQILTALTDARPGSVLPYTAELGLSVNLPIFGKWRLPIHREGKLPIPTRPEIDIEDVEWDKLTFDSAEATLKIRVTNRNRFPVDIARMSYILTLSSMEVAESSLASPVSLDANDGEGTVEIEISFSPRRFGRAALRLLTGDTTYQFSGEISVDTRYGPMTLPFDRSGDLKRRR